MGGLWEEWVRKSRSLSLLRSRPGTRSLSKVYRGVMSRGRGLRSGMVCTQQPALPAKLRQDVTELGFILVPSVVSV